MRPFVFAFVIAAFTLGCPQEPRERPDVVCADACVKRIVGCTPKECERGCAFVIDRLVEHEQDTVLSCVERGAACADANWAECAAKVGPHVDGGPETPPEVPPVY